MPKILIVDDSEMNIDMLSKWLRKKGFDVLAASHGQEGIDQATAELPDLVLMDLTMPGINGWDATRILKSDPVTEQIPVIALSAHTLEEDRRCAIDAGCDEFEGKPLNLKRLTDKILDLISD